VIEVVTCRDEADEQVSLDVWNEVWPHERVGLSEVHSYKAGLRDNLDLIARVDGALAGSAVCGIEPQRPDLATALVTVLEDRRRRGAGTALYEAISAWARERGLDVMEAVVADNDPESLEFAWRRGFVEDRREKGVALGLAEIESPLVEAPDGIEIVTWAERPELAHGMYEVAVEAFPDIPGWEHELIEPFEDWLAHDMQGSGDRPDATFVAVANDEVVGYAKFSLTDATPMTAHHDLTGVKRAWRGHGIARALKATQIAWAKANGYEELRTRNDERNAPIRYLNEEFGYRPTIGRIYLKGPLAVGPTGQARTSS
jgi:GNAT superfamily N-acetyltransferase